MSTHVTQFADLRPGEIYEDTCYHPCLCIAVDNGAALGISLIDGSYPRSADIGISNVRKLTPAEAWRWRMCGPEDADVSVTPRWWNANTIREWERSIRSGSEPSDGSG